MFRRRQMLRVLREPVEILELFEFPARIIHVRVCRGCFRRAHSDAQVSKQEKDDRFKCVSVYSISKGQDPSPEKSRGVFIGCPKCKKGFYYGP